MFILHLHDISRYIKLESYPPLRVPQAHHCHILTVEVDTLQGARRGHSVRGSLIPIQSWRRCSQRRKPSRCCPQTPRTSCGRTIWCFTFSFFLSQNIVQCVQIFRLLCMCFHWTCFNGNQFTNYWNYLLKKIKNLFCSELKPESWVLPCLPSPLLSCSTNFWGSRNSSGGRDRARFKIPRLKDFQGYSSRKQNCGCNVICMWWCL